MDGGKNKLEGSKGRPFLLTTYRNGMRSTMEAAMRASTELKEEIR